MGVGLRVEMIALAMRSKRLYGASSSSFTGQDTVADRLFGCAPGGRQKRSGDATAAPQQGRSRRPFDAMTSSTAGSLTGGTARRSRVTCQSPQRGSCSPFNVPSYTPAAKSGFRTMILARQSAISPGFRSGPRNEKWGNRPAIGSQGRRSGAAPPDFAPVAGGQVTVEGPKMAPGRQTHHCAQSRPRSQERAGVTLWSVVRQTRWQSACTLSMGHANVALSRERTREA